MTDCPACGSNNGLDLPEPRGPLDAPLRYRRCLDCGCVFAPERLAHARTAAEWDAIPRPRPGDHGAAALVRSLRGNGHVALAGRADEALLDTLALRGYAACACDPSWRAVEPLQKQGKPAHKGTPHSGALLPGQDMVIVEGLLEYTHDPLAELLAIRESLRPDGRVRIETPFVDGLAVQQYGPDHFLFAPPAVAALYSFESLTRLCARAGFTHVSRADAPARSLAWHFDRQPYGRRWLRVLERNLDRFYQDRSVLAVVARVD